MGIGLNILLFESAYSLQSDPELININNSDSLYFNSDQKKA
jgi:hypothetical protein